MPNKNQKKALKLFRFSFLILNICLICLSLITFSSWGKTNKDKIIVLTFDDGPRPEVLKELLSTLEKYNVPGTFFMVGWAIAKNKDLVKKMHEMGYEIENHSYSHENFKKLFKEKGEAEIKANLKKCDEVIFQVTGKHSRFFRPPFWEINEEIEKIIQAENYKVMKLNQPDINTEDYLDFSKNHPPEILAEKVKKIISQREKYHLYSHVLTFHELLLTVKALKILIPYFQAQGYKFLRLDEYFGELNK